MESLLTLVLGDLLRVLTKGVSAEVQITLRAQGMAGPTTRPQPIPLEPFAVNKDMGRLLLRRGGESIAAGIHMHVVLPIFEDSLSVESTGIVLDVNPRAT